VNRSPPTDQFVLIDDTITRGRTLLAAAAVLYHAVPGASIGACALMRAETDSPYITALTDPLVGHIHYSGGDALRSP
jgi:hypothetical protein